MEFVTKRVENIVGKGENAAYQHFLLFLQCLQKLSSIGSLKVTLNGKKLIKFNNTKYRFPVNNINTVGQVEWNVSQGSVFPHTTKKLITKLV